MNDEQRAYAAQEVENLHGSTRTIVGSAILLCAVLLLGWVAIKEPITPSEDDCAARGKAADCWREVTP